MIKLLYRYSVLVHVWETGVQQGGLELGTDPASPSPVGVVTGRTLVSEQSGRSITLMHPNIDQTV